MGTFIPMLLLLVLFTSAIVLQIFLSNKKHKLLGFILPIASFIVSIVAVLIVLGFLNLHQTNGLFEAKSVIKLWNERSDENIRQFISILIGTALNYFFLINIATVVFILVNVACKRKQKKNLALQKMSIQDLE